MKDHICGSVAADIVNPTMRKRIIKNKPVYLWFIPPAPLVCCFASWNYTKV